MSGWPFFCSENIAQGEVDTELLGAVGPLCGEAEWANEAVVGIGESYARKVLLGDERALFATVKAHEEVVGSGQVVFSVEIIS